MSYINKILLFSLLCIIKITYGYISVSEVDSLQWISEQYNLNWDIDMFNACKFVSCTTPNLLGFNYVKDIKLILSDINLPGTSTATLNLNFQNLQSIQIIFSPHNLTAPTFSKSILDYIQSSTCTYIEMQYDNTIVSIPNDLLSRVPKLKTLILRNTLVTSVPDNIVNKLNKLDLTGNQILHFNLNQTSSSLQSLSINVGLLGLLNINITPLNFPNLIDLKLGVGLNTNTNNTSLINIVVDFGQKDGSLSIDSPQTIGNLTIPTNLSKIELNTTKIINLNGVPTEDGITIPESYCNLTQIYLSGANILSVPDCLKCLFGKANISLPFSFSPSFNFSCGELRYPIVTGANPLLSNDTIVILNGLFGNSSFDDVVVTINGEICDLVQYSENQIKCNQNFTNISGQVPLFVSVNGSNFTSNSLINIVNIQSPNFCNCIHGKCNMNGECLCDVGYQGIDCSKVVLKADYYQNNIKPEASFTFGNSSFNFSIAEIQEIDSNDNIIRNLTIENYMQNSFNISIKTDIQYIDSSKYIHFANESIYFDEGTSKVTINITGWPYLVSSSHLRVLFKMNFNYSLYNESEIAPILTSYRSIQQPFYNFFISYKDQISFYGRFLSLMLSDKITSYSMVELMSSTESSLLIGVHLPQCTQCIIDPDFSLLVKPDSADSSDGSGQYSSSLSIFKKTWVIITVATVCGVVLLSAIFATVFTIIKIKKHKKEKETISKRIGALRDNLPTP